MAGSMDVKEYFKDVKVPVFAGGRTRVDVEDLSEGEVAAIRKVFSYGIEQLRRVSPAVAADIEVQLDLAVKVARIFKAMAGRKPFSFPSSKGTLGVAWLWPGAIRYAATPSATAPAYTSYPPNSWTLTLTAGTPVYFLGDGTNFYRASPDAANYRRSMLLIFHNGVIEMGSTPKLATFQIVSETESGKYGVYSVAPVVEERVEPGRNIYQYPTPMGAVIAFYDTGVMWGAMPLESGVSTIKLLGLVFYEHDLYPNLAATYIR